jgi:thiosulfate/3-mercaptopyruvate sulfurtransferase
MTFHKPHYLVETAWLAEHLDDADLRVIDCSVDFVLGSDAAGKQTVSVVSGRDAWRSGHIPGSAFVDLTRELKDVSNSALMFAMPDGEQFAAVMSDIGVGPGSRVVLYDSRANIWY